jgi:hypothetical protein
VFADELWRHLSIGIDAYFGAIAIGLDGAHFDEADGVGAFDFGVAAQLFEFLGGDFDVHVDAVEKRAGNF